MFARSSRVFRSCLEFHFFILCKILKSDTDPRKCVLKPMQTSLWNPDASTLYPYNLCLPLKKTAYRPQWNRWDEKTAKSDISRIFVTWKILKLCLFIPELLYCVHVGHFHYKWIRKHVEMSTTNLVTRHSNVGVFIWHARTKMSHWSPCFITDSEMKSAYFPVFLTFYPFQRCSFVLHSRINCSTTTLIDNG